ncbi:hypothetical protein I302_101504 [Kwoniella bestiolae CBS 10118]|uniref:Transcriptional activator HAP5 n=1 Tax=Kwoniella bestiolae CBS 10118 TaxID=1296100 RepID=A0A1B9GCF8_9TREE|nr:transcriptional activator HAP5 [Kwoniella bestiolae CBS 10118]OCF28699.1 transcriptional activator HAP5 [Kwoniella bestiolae CBS 10118]
MNPSYFLPSGFPPSASGAGPSNYASSGSASGSTSPEPQTHQQGNYPSSSSHQHAQPQKKTYQTQAEQRQLLHPPNIQGPLIQPNQDLNTFLENFWERQMNTVEGEIPDWKSYNLPLARIKKVMKSDEDVRMISAEAPIMFSKACEIFISELTCRAWLVAESHKRRTLQKSDVASAIAFSDMFDFLIDIVPRDDGTASTSNNNQGEGEGDGSVVDEENNTSLVHDDIDEVGYENGHDHGHGIQGVNPQDINGQGQGQVDEGEDLYNKYVQED